MLHPLLSLTIQNGGVLRLLALSTLPCYWFDAERRGRHSQMEFGNEKKREKGPGSDYFINSTTPRIKNKNQAWPLLFMDHLYNHLLSRVRDPHCDVAPCAAY